MCRNTSRQQYLCQFLFIIIAGKGFPPSKIKEELEKRTGPHILKPIKRIDVRITDNDMLSCEGVLEGIEGHVLYKKKRIKGDCFLYVFKDTKKAVAEEATFLVNSEG